MKRFIKEVSNEMIYIGFALFFALCFMTMEMEERLFIVGMVEATFASTRVYVEVKRLNNKKRFNKRKDNVKDFKKGRKENRKAQ